MVRKICKNCKIEKKFSTAEIKSLSESLFLDWFNNEKVFYFGSGCEKCSNTGYKGRVALHEIILISDILRQAILRKSPAAEIKALSVKQGMVSMTQDGIDKAANGVTTIEEILRIAHE